MIAARSVSVIVRGDDLGRRQRAVRHDHAPAGRARPGGSRRRAAGPPAGGRPRAPPLPRPPARDGTARPDRSPPPAGARPASRWARYSSSRARSSASGSGSSSGSTPGVVSRPPRQHRPALDQDQLARDRDERADVAEPVAVERRERVEVGVGERAERDGQDVELARLDEGEQQGKRPVEALETDLGRGLGTTAGAEHDRGRRPAGAIDVGDPLGRVHQLASSASRSRSPASGSTRLRPGGGSARRSGRVQPAARGQLGRGVGVDAEPLDRAAPARARAPADAPDPRAVAARPASTRPAARAPVSPLAQSWSSPATSTSRSVMPPARRCATTSRPWRRSATCIASNRASSAGRSQVASVVPLRRIHPGPDVGDRPGGSCRPTSRSPGDR